jgi:hypothetical protein
MQPGSDWGSLFDQDLDDELVDFTDIFQNSWHEQTSGVNSTCNHSNNSIVFHQYFSKEFICKGTSCFNALSQREVLRYDSSDKIILPPSSLGILASSGSSLYVLRIMNSKNSKYAFVGVGDFTAPERTMFAPSWIMDLLCISSGDRIYVDAMSVPKITYAKIKVPTEFKLISDDKGSKDSSALNLNAVIEFALRNHCLLFIGKRIPVKIFDKKWEFEVVSLKPTNIGSITDTDVHLDLA